MPSASSVSTKSLGLLSAIALVLLAAAMPATAGTCDFRGCGAGGGGGPVVQAGGGALTAAYFSKLDGLGYASKSAPEPQRYQWQLLTQCEFTDPVAGGCEPDQAVCQQAANRLTAYYIVESQRLVPPD